MLNFSPNKLSKICFFLCKIRVFPVAVGWYLSLPLLQLFNGLLWPLLTSGGPGWLIWPPDRTHGTALCEPKPAHLAGVPAFIGCLGIELVRELQMCRHLLVCCVCVSLA